MTTVATTVKDILPYPQHYVIQTLLCNASGVVCAHIREVCLDARLRTGLCGLVHCTWHMHPTVSSGHHVDLDHWRGNGRAFYSVTVVFMCFSACALRSFSPLSSTVCVPWLHLPRSPHVGGCAGCMSLSTSPLPSVVLQCLLALSDCWAAVAATSATLDEPSSSSLSLG